MREGANVADQVLRVIPGGLEVQANLLVGKGGNLDKFAGLWLFCELDIRPIDTQRFLSDSTYE